MVHAGRFEDVVAQIGDELGSRCSLHHGAEHVEAIGGIGIVCARLKQQRTVLEDLQRRETVRVMARAVQFVGALVVPDAAEMAEQFPDGYRPLLFGE